MLRSPSHSSEPGEHAVRQAFVRRSQERLRQSLFDLQNAAAKQPSQIAPPQSTSLSSPSRKPSLHVVLSGSGCPALPATPPPVPVVPPSPAVPLVSVGRPIVAV